MGFRDLRGSLEQFNLLPVDPEIENQLKIERFMSEASLFVGLPDDDLPSLSSEPTEEWTVVYDKFAPPHRF